MSEKIDIAILGGGFSSEREIALQSAQSMYSWLQHTPYTPWLIDVRGRLWMALVDGKEYRVDLNDFSIPLPDQRIQLKAALLAIHGTPGENGLLQGYLETMGIPFTSGSTFTEAITFHKKACKLYLQGLVPMAQDVQIILRREADVYSLERELGYPMFVKPNTNGSSVGVTKATDRHSLVQGLKRAFGLGNDVLVEKAIQGTEVSCGLLAINGKITVLPITELVSPAEFFDYQTKYDGSTQEITPARISTTASDRIASYSRAIYRRLQCRGLVRIDYIVQDDLPYFLEINTVPGMTKESIVPKQVKVMGQTMPEILSLILNDILA